MEKLLISTRNKLILWDGKQHTIWKEPPETKYHYFYGITWDRNNIYISERLQRNQSVIHVFDSKLRHKYVLSLSQDVGDVHQIYFWNGILYITDAYTESVILWDGKNSKSVRWKREEDPYLHINSIWCDGNNFFVSEHRKDKAPKRIKMFNLEFSDIGSIDLSWHDFLKPWPYGIHNVYIEDGILYTGGPFVFVKHNLVSGETEPAPIDPDLIQNRYVRGLAKTSGKFFIGLSNVEKRNKRREGDSSILVTNNKFEKLDIIELNGTGGVHDIRVIDGIDLAHNGLKCPH